jgi:hypothetical protein
MFSCFVPRFYHQCGVSQLYHDDLNDLLVPPADRVKDSVQIREESAGGIRVSCGTRQLFIDQEKAYNKRVYIIHDPSVHICVLDWILMPITFIL